MSIKAADVKKLRDMTGAGMLDCKNALVEAEGDFKKAEKHLKELGLAAAAKRSDRATNQGRVTTRITDDKAVILELACETDFVARNKDFIALGDQLIDMILEKGYTEINDELEGLVKDLISKIKENMSLKRFQVIDIAENQMVTDYIHGEGTIGVLVSIEADDPSKINQELKDFAFDCALHIAAFSPQYLDKADVDAEYIKEQNEIYTKQVELLGKPANIIENIVKGKLSKHFTEICLLQQKFVKDDNLSVEQVLKNVSKSIGTPCRISGYTYFKVGQ
ncbi:MAG: translation elongation factor Ts [Spirochaetia bacterium]|nr:translation elongation factor Ts [Spirochaetia bacterium]MCF7940159.1 translation elongation factor Ts [Spirochaetia bacterium]